MLKSLLGPLLTAIAALFLAVPAMLAPAGPAMAATAYKIHPGDMLQLEVLEDSTLNRALLVLPDGSISVPLAGSIRAAGQTVDQLRQTITAKLAPNFAARPTVYLSVGQIAARSSGGATMSVFAIGEVAKPGKIDVDRGTTLLQFLAESGGLTNYAATKRIQLRRLDRATGQERSYLFNYDAVASGAAVPPITLQPGDVIIVPQRRLFE